MKTCPDVKINLGLHILRRREDGFHDLETLFLPYGGISDGLEIVEAEEFAFRPSANVTWDNDLTVRAYNLLKADFDLPPVEIRLDKKSPVGAGLGSGSSDAAFTLCMLNDMFRLGLDDAALAGYAARLGSDCAFFVYNRPMFGEGRGEILAPYEIDLSGYEIRVEIPQGVSVSTKEAYSKVVPRNLLPEQMSLREALSRPVEEWKDCLVNDFEPSVFALYPQIEALKNSMYERGAVYASMSGSGSSVFGIFRK